MRPELLQKFSSIGKAARELSYVLVFVLHSYPESYFDRCYVVIYLLSSYRFATVNGVTNNLAMVWYVKCTVLVPRSFLCCGSGFIDHDTVKHFDDS